MYAAEVGVFGAKNTEAQVRPTDLPGYKDAIPRPGGTPEEWLAFTDIPEGCNGNMDRLAAGQVPANEGHAPPSRSFEGPDDKGFEIHVGETGGQDQVHEKRGRAGAIGREVAERDGESLPAE